MASANDWGRKIGAIARAQREGCSDVDKDLQNQATAGYYGYDGSGEAGKWSCKVRCSPSRRIGANVSVRVLIVRLQYCASLLSVFWQFGSRMPKASTLTYQASPIPNASYHL